MKNRDESFIGDTSIKIYETLRKMGKSTHPVGGLIPPKEEHEWKKLRNRFEKYGVNMNKGGLIYTVKWANKIMDATCPIAEEIDFHPVGFTDDMVNLCAEQIKTMNTKNWAEQSKKLKKDIVEKTDQKIMANIDKKPI